MCEFIGKDPEEVLAGTLMPFRTTNWNDRRDRPNIDLTLPFWCEVLAAGKIREIFCMGRKVESAVVKLTEAKLTLKIPANWGKLSIQRYETKSGARIFGLLHFSTYKMFGRPKCISQIADLLDVDIVIEDAVAHG